MGPLPPFMFGRKRYRKTKHRIIGSTESNYYLLTLTSLYRLERSPLIEPLFLIAYDLTPNLRLLRDGTLPPLSLLTPRDPLVTKRPLPPPLGEGGGAGLRNSSRLDV